MSKYADDNCHQCWLCENQIGYFDGQFEFPECKVTDMYMNLVYEDPCRYFSLKSKYRQNDLNPVI